MFAKDTEVSSERSRAEIEHTLNRFGASSFAYASHEKGAMIEFQVGGKRIRFVLPMPSRHDERFTLGPCMGKGNAHGAGRTGYHTTGCFKERSESVAYGLWEQATRELWRALSISIKAKLVTVEANISTLEREFMAQIVLPNNQTAGDVMLPQIEQFYLDKKVTALAWDGVK